MEASAPRIDLRKAVDAYGTYAALARRLGLSLSTVHGWYLRDRVPKWRANQIAAAAQADGFDVIVKKKRVRRKSVQ